MSRSRVSVAMLRARGIEVLARPRGRLAALLGRDGTIELPEHTVLEAPGSLKRTRYDHSIELGAFSYQVSGYCFAARIGRYCSFGEDVQIGRQNHPTTWVSTSPAFYLGDRLFGLGDGFGGAKGYHSYKFSYKGPPTRARITTIGHDVWIGHNAYVAAGVTIGDGAIVAAHAVVARDVPPYAVVAGNPAAIKKMRLPPETVAAMARARWWRFAPWQLDHLDPSDVAGFLRGVGAMEGRVEPFAPDVVDLRRPKAAR